MTHLIAQRLNNPAINSAVGTIPVGGSGTTIIQRFIGNFMTFAFGVAVLILLVMLLIGSYEYITAGGDKEGVQKAQKRMTQALIGLLILLSIYLIANVVGILFGINVLQINIPLLV